MDINIWLERFKKYWQAHNIKGVLSLFDRDVIYYESPSLKLKNFDAIAKEWDSIEMQKNIELEFNVISNQGNKHNIVWKLHYIDEFGKTQYYFGTYMIELNDKGLCNYFYQTCDSN